MKAPFDVTTKLGYLETIGRVSGRRRETEIWFAWEDGTIYLLSGGGLAKDWIRNFRKTPEVRFRVGETWVTGRARIVEDPELDGRIRRVVAGKYYGFDPDSDALLPNEWSRTAVPVVITSTPAREVGPCADNPFHGNDTGMRVVNRGQTGMDRICDHLIHFVGADRIGNGEAIERSVPFVSARGWRNVRLAAARARGSTWSRPLRNGGMPEWSGDWCSIPRPHNVRWSDRAYDGRGFAVGSLVSGKSDAACRNEKRVV